MNTKSLLYTTLLILAPFLSLKTQAQSGYIYYCHEAVYKYTFVNKADGGSLTFYENGDVAIDGKIDKRFSFEFYDCTIELHYQGKKINELTCSIMKENIGEHEEYFIDNRNIKYYSSKRIN